MNNNNKTLLLREIYFKFVPVPFLCLQSSINSATTKNIDMLLQKSSDLDMYVTKKAKANPINPPNWAKNDEVSSDEIINVNATTAMEYSTITQNIQPTETWSTMSP